MDLEISLNTLNHNKQTRFPHSTNFYPSSLLMKTTYSGKKALLHFIIAYGAEEFIDAFISHFSTFIILGFSSNLN